MSSERLSHADMADDLRKMVTSKSTWLETFSSGSKKRPEGELETQRKHLTCCSRPLTIISAPPTGRQQKATDHDQ